MPVAPTVHPGGAVPPDAPHQPQAVRLHTAQVTRDLSPEPAAAAAHSRDTPALGTRLLTLTDKEPKKLHR